MTLQKPVHQVVATVLGAGTMGAGIAAHLAATGAKTYLLDIVPPSANGSTDKQARNALATKALKALTKSRPPALMSRSVLERIVPGNFDDHLAEAVGQSDLVIEAVVERLDIKAKLLSRVAASSRDDAIVATNTSGIPIAKIAEEIPESQRRRFLGLHFFNPPRWMHLLEVIPGPQTEQAAVEEASAFCDRALGKGIVPCKDTPNFIGNRIGIVEMLLTLRAAKEEELTVEEVDFLNGPLIGRPKTGSFRLADLVGLDVIAHVVKNLEEGLSSDPRSSSFDPLYEIMKVPEVISQLVEKGRLGDKSGAGFYQKTRDESGKKILSLDLQTLEYRDHKEPPFEDLARSIKLADLATRVRETLRREDRAGRFLRRVLLPLFNYSATLAGQICESPAQIDDAMRWGYGWQLGPLELLDAAGVSWVKEQLEASGEVPAPAIQALVERAGADAQFYGGTPQNPTVYVHPRGPVPRPRPQGAIILDEIRDSATLKHNPTARLIDLGDGIACLEFASKANVLDEGVVALISEAPEWLFEKGFRGLVLGNQADHFCRGANLVEVARLIQKQDFDAIETLVRELQDAYMNLRHGPIPVVGAPLGQSLGGGTEALLHCAAVEAGADLFMGLVEVGVGVLPAAGGLKEIARRASRWAAQVPDHDPEPWVRRGFEAVAMAKISSSALEAKEMGYLSDADRVVFHRARVIESAKRRAASFSVAGWEPPPRDEPIRVVGETGGANMLMGLQLFGWGGYASEHDQLIGRKIVHVLSGGMARHGQTLTAQELLDLEREAFVSLCGEEKTQKRIEHMLTTKRPLRN